MNEKFEYISKTKLVYEDGLCHAYIGEVPEPVEYGMQGELKRYYGVPDDAPNRISTLDHIVAAVGG